MASIIKQAKAWLAKDKDNKVILRFKENNPNQVINNFNREDFARIQTTGDLPTSDALDIHTRFFDAKQG